MLMSFMSCSIIIAWHENRDPSSIASGEHSPTNNSAIIRERERGGREKEREIHSSSQTVVRLSERERGGRERERERVMNSSSQTVVRLSERERGGGRES